MDEQNVERYLADVHVSHENLFPAKSMNFWRRLRFRLFLFLRLISRSAYYAHGLGDEVQLSGRDYDSQGALGGRSWGAQ